MPTDAALHKHLMDRWLVLKNLRLSWETVWRDIAKYQAPQRGEFWRAPNTNNRGVQKTQAILDPRAVFARRTLTAGLMGSLTSPTRPWFRLTVSDQRVAQIGSVRQWLDQLAEGMLLIFSESNIYETLLLLYDELGTFGTGVSVLEEDFDDVLRAYPLTTGEYWLGIDHRGRVDTLYRRFMWSARQCVQRWGLEACGPEIRRMVEGTQADTELPILHAIEPNTDYEPDKLDARGKKWRSVYWREQAKSGELISIGGYSMFPVLSPRWRTVSNDPYGTGPGHEALPDVKSLQVLAKRRHSAVDKHVNPPMAAPAELAGKPSGTVPGHINYFMGDLAAKMMRPIYQTNPAAFAPLQALIDDTRRLIDEAYYVPVFLMISQMDGVQPRNQIEIISRKEEKMLMLGPVLDALRGELLKPLVDYTYGLMVKHQLFNAHNPPEEAAGYTLDIELISVLAQAQKASRVGSIERVAGFVGSLAGANPEVLDKLDMDEAVDQYADSVGAPVNVVRADEAVTKRREARARQVAQQQALQAGLAVTEGAKNLSQTEVGAGRNALQTITGL